MTQFSRRARWLNQLFPASKAPQTKDPGSVSDDVSLTQPYDGSGWPLPDFASWIIQKDSPVGIDGQTDMITVPEGSVYRLFSANSFRLIPANAQTQLFVTNLGGIPVTAVALADPVSTGFQQGNNIYQFQKSIVVPAGLTLRFEHFLGDVNTQIRFGIYGCLAPAGTAFYC